MNSEDSTGNVGKYDKGADGYSTLTVPLVEPMNLFHCLTEGRDLKTYEGVEKQPQKLPLITSVHYEGDSSDSSADRFTFCESTGDNQPPVKWVPGPSRG